MTNANNPPVEDTAERSTRESGAKRTPWQKPAMQKLNGGQAEGGGGGALDSPYTLS